MRLRSQRFARSYFITDAFYLLTGFIAGGSLALAYVTYAGQLVGRVLIIPRLSELRWPLWLLVMAAVFALDAGNYLAHYCLHRFGVLWELHKVHHSSKELDWLATFRSHIGEQILRRLLAPVLLIAFGFPLNAVTIAGGFFIGWSILNHANLRIKVPFLETIFITPRLHRIHHINNAPNKNLGTIFTFWDRWRGTFDATMYSDHCELGNGEKQYPQSWFPQFFKPLPSILSRPPMPSR
jgi:sterol desaturase/sphingolipid hydroxylase (fatty acid hydroxylase superfamily)